MQGESIKNIPIQRVSIHRNMSLKDYCIIAGMTLVSLPIGFYFGNAQDRVLLYIGRGNGKFVQNATMYTTGLIGLMGGYSMALVNTRKRVLGE